MIVTDDQYERLQPPHLVTTVRSFPRRYREALTAWSSRPVSARTLDDEANVLALLNDTLHTLALLDHALEQCLVRDTPVVDERVLHGAARPWPISIESDAADASKRLLVDLTTTTSTLALRIDNAPSKSWSGEATVANTSPDRTIRAIDIAREAARTGAENLRAIDRFVGQPTE